MVIMILELWGAIFPEKTFCRLRLPLNSSNQYVTGSTKIYLQKGQNTINFFWNNDDESPQSSLELAKVFLRSVDVNTRADLNQDGAVDSKDAAWFLKQRPEERIYKHIVVNASDYYLVKDPSGMYRFLDQNGSEVAVSDTSGRIVKLDNQSYLIFKDSQTGKVYVKEKLVSDVNWDGVVDAADFDYLRTQAALYTEYLNPTDYDTKDSDWVVINLNGTGIILSVLSGSMMLNQACLY